MAGSCDGEVQQQASGTASATDDALVYLDDLDYLMRASMALRGVRPSPGEIAAVEADPSQLDAIVDGYVESPEFLEVMADLHAEMLLLRTDSVPQLPALGALSHSSAGEIYERGTAEPLKLVAYIIDNDRPYTEVVTADYLLTDELNAIMWGLDYDPEGPEWQLTWYKDGRPPAGLLSSAEMMVRHQSNAANFHRGRANMVARTFLCEDFDVRDIAIDGGIDIADELEVANAVMTNPSCVNCHQALDPLAAYFWGFRDFISARQIGVAYSAGCSWDYSGGATPGMGLSYLPGHYCYPLQQYTPTDEDNWADWGLRPPAYYGQPAEDLADVGQLIADDPRFSQCMAKRFFAWFAHLEPEDVPIETAVALQLAFEESGFDAKALSKAVIAHPSFRSFASTDPEGGPLTAQMRAIRPEQYARTVEDLTGYRWWAYVDSPTCANGSDGSQCWGEVDLSNSDLYGFRAMSGGIDGYWAVRPTHQSTPVKLLVTGQIAANAAGWVVDEDFAQPDPAARRLLTLVAPDTTDEEAIRAQLAELHRRILVEPVAPDGPEVDASFELFSAALASRDDPAAAWKVTLIGLLQDVRMLWY